MSVVLLLCQCYYCRVSGVDVVAMVLVLCQWSCVSDVTVVYGVLLIGNFGLCRVPGYPGTRAMNRVPGSVLPVLLPESEILL